MADEVNIRFGATIDDLRDKLSQVMGLFRGIADGAQAELAQRAAGSFGVFGKDAERAATGLMEKWKELPASLRAVAVAVGTVGAAIGAGMFAKKMADENAEMVESTRDLARAFGTTTNEASVLRAAFDDIGVSQGEFEGAAKGLARQLAQNEGALNKMGLVTRDAAGQLRPLTDLTVDAIGVLGEYREGTDRAVAAKELFGRGISASSRLMLLNAEVIKANREAVAELGLEVGERAVAGWADYDTAADRAALTLKGFAKAIQEAVLPVATELTNWFNFIGPFAITAFRGAIGGLSTAFLGLTNGVVVVWETLNAMVVSVAEPIRAVAVAIGQALTGNFTGAAETIKGVPGVIVNAWGAAYDKILASSQNTSDRIGRIWAGAAGPDSKPGASGSPGGTRSASMKGGDKPGGGDDGGKTAAAALALAKAQGEAALALEREHAREAQAIYDDAHASGLLSIREYYDAKLAIELSSIEQSLAAKRRELAEVEGKQGDGGGKEADRLKLLAAAAKLQGEINVLTAREADAVRANTAAREQAEQKLQADLAGMKAAAAKASADDAVNAERKALEQQRALGEVSAQQAFAAERDLEQRSYAATVAALQARAALIRGTDAEVQKAREALRIEAEQAERQHQAKLTDINRAAALERRKDSIQATQQMQGSFAKMVSDVIGGTQSIGGAIREFANNIKVQFTNLIAQKLTEKLFNAVDVGKWMNKMFEFVSQGVTKMVAWWNAGETAKATATASAEAVKTGAVAAGAATRLATEEGAAAASKESTIGSAIVAIGAKAWEAAASVYAAIASIPYVGPFLAPAMAIAAGALVMGFVGRIASSEGGEMRVSEDRLNFVHKNETILPAPFAHGLRNMIGEGGMSPLQATLQQIQSAVTQDAGEAAVSAGRAPGEDSAVGRMVMRWRDGDQDAQGDTGPMLERFQALLAGGPVGTRGGGTAWQLPANPLPGIQARASAPAPQAMPQGLPGIGGGRPQGGGGAGGAITINAMDRRSVERLIRDNGRHVASTLRAQARNFAPKR